LSSPFPVSQLSLFASSRWPPCRSRPAVSLDAVSLVSYCQLRCDLVVVPSPRPRLVSICHFRQPQCQLSVLSIISSVELPVSFSSPGHFVVCPLHCIASVLVSYQSPQMFLSSFVQVWLVSVSILSRASAPLVFGYSQTLDWLFSPLDFAPWTPSSVGHESTRVPVLVVATFLDRWHCDWLALGLAFYTVDSSAFSQPLVKILYASLATWLLQDASDTVDLSGPSHQPFQPTVFITSASGMSPYLGLATVDILGVLTSRCSFCSQVSQAWLARTPRTTR